MQKGSENDKLVFLIISTKNSFTYDRYCCHNDFWKVINISHNYYERFLSFLVFFNIKKDIIEIFYPCLFMQNIFAMFHFSILTVFTFWCLVWLTSSDAIDCYSMFSIAHNWRKLLPYLRFLKFWRNAWIVGLISHPRRSVFSVFAF